MKGGGINGNYNYYGRLTPLNSADFLPIRNLKSKIGIALTITPRSPASSAASKKENSASAIC
jgi:hypothetical protein